MGQKVNPIGFRTAVHKQWKSRWFAERKEFGNLLNEDLVIRDMVRAKLKEQGMQVNHFADGELARVQEIARGIYPQFEAQIGAEFMQKSLDFVKK